MNLNSEQQSIHKIIQNWCQALEAKDINSIMADYAEDVLIYDAIPPYKTESASALKQIWDNCLPYFPKKFLVETRDLKIKASYDLAFASFLIHLTPVGEDSPCGQTWLRVTSCYEKRDGVWKIVHDHVSIPFDPMTNMACMIENP
ncbi:MAG: nuclear transport factor 2 family protein [Candidatus Cloacimonetes bacterium]|nr:nuclear transport factor 2 family protein [Candidatus Cloacimonadota bacterium]